MEIQINNLKNINISAVNARMLNLNTNGALPTEIREQYQELGHTFISEKILGLKFAKDILIEIGDTYNINNTKYIINSILPSEDGYYLIDSIFNKSALYLLPLLKEENKTATNYLISTCLYNTYLYCDKFPQYNDNNHLFLAYKFINHEGYKKLELEITKQRNFVELYEPNENFVVFIMRFNKEHKEAIKLFLEGNYHNIDPILKEQIISFYNLKDYKITQDNVRRVLTRDLSSIKKLENCLGCTIPKNMSFDSKPIIENETFKL